MLPARGLDLGPHAFRHDALEMLLRPLRIVEFNEEPHQHILRAGFQVEWVEQNERLTGQGREVTEKSVALGHRNVFQQVTADEGF